MSDGVTPLGVVFSPDRVSTVTFDSYSTLVDVDGIRPALADHVEEPDAVAKLWRRRSLDYARLSVPLEDYQTFYEMNRDALEYALAAHDIDLDAETREEVLSVYHDLPVFDDVRDAIEAVYDGGYDVYVVSNGDPEMLGSMIDQLGIGEFVEDTVSADEVETFKPHAEIYRHAAARTGTPIDRIAHVTAGWVDTLGAMHAGMQAVWLNRAGRPWEAFGESPDLTVEGLEEIAAALR